MKQAAAGAASTTQAVKADKKPFFSQRTLSHFIDFLFVLPALILLGVFTYYPIVKLVQISFTDWNLLNDTWKYVGLKNWQWLFAGSGAKYLWNSLKVTFLYSMGEILVTMGGGMLLALLFNRMTRSFGLMRAFVFVPKYVAMSSAAVVFLWILNTDSGVLNYLLQCIGAVARRPYEGDDARQRVEFLAVLSEEITKLRNSLDACDVELTTEVYASLLRRHLQTVRIPFEGEPLEGIQIMGILETRNLDFEHVLLLSMNDDNFPGNLMGQGSFVPYNLRAAFSLPTPEHHEGVYAYYFYRLIQRASDVRMLYCAHADDKSTGEPSRYIHQIDYESGLPVARVEVGVDVNLAETAPIEVAKDAAVMASLERFVSPESEAALSPTAFFRYVACPLRFYFHSVARLRVDDEVSEEIDAPMFGTILHAAAQALYTPLVGEHAPGATLRALLRTDAVDRAVTRAINLNYLCDEQAVADDYTGNLLLVRDIVTRYLRGGVMPYDAAHDAFTVEALEQQVAHAFPFDAGGRRLEMKVAGIADRIDRLDDGTLRVVDYKTGAAHLDFAGVESLFRGTGKQRLSNILQTLLYAMILYRTRGIDAVPALYYVRNMHGEDYSPLLVDRETGLCGASYALYAGRFEELLRETLAELYDPAVPFRQCDDPDTCRFCDFNVICKR